MRLAVQAGLNASVHTPMYRYSSRSELIEEVHNRLLRVCEKIWSGVPDPYELVVSPVGAEHARPILRNRWFFSQGLRARRRIGEFTEPRP